ARTDGRTEQTCARLARRDARDHARGEEQARQLVDDSCRRSARDAQRVEAPRACDDGEGDETRRDSRVTRERHGGPHSTTNVPRSPNMIHEWVAVSGMLPDWSREPAPETVVVMS